MAYTHEDLASIEKHVAQGERNVRRQQHIVNGLREAGYATGEALNLLTALETTLYELQQRRSQIRRALLCQDIAQRMARDKSRPEARR